MTTSPLAESPEEDRLNTMLPLRPVDVLWYSPLHLPASEARSPASPVTVMGDGFEAHASATAANDVRNILDILTDPPRFGVRRKGGWQ